MHQGYQLTSGTPRIAYESHGQGEPIVFVHGVGATWTTGGTSWSISAAIIAPWHWTCAATAIATTSPAP